MSIDSYSKKNLDQVKKDKQIVDGIELDDDLKEILKKAKTNLERESIELGRQNEYNEVIKELNSSTPRSLDQPSRKSIDSPLLFNTNTTNNSQSIQQEESPINLGRKYSDEEVIEARESMQRNSQLRAELLNMLEKAINKENNLDYSNEENHTPRHR